jgi:hypothetical protein
MGEKPTGTGQETDEDAAAAAAQKEQGPTKGAGATPAAGDSGRAQESINLTRSNIKGA